MKRTQLLIEVLLCSMTSIGLAFAETKVGVILPMTGDFAQYGDKVRQGLESTRPEGVRYIYEDEGCSPKTAVSAHKKLTAVDGVQLLIGPWCGSPQTAVASLLPRSRQIALLGSSAPERVFELSGGRMLSVQPSIEQESTFNAEQAYRIGARNVVIVFLENDFSRAHEAAFREHFKGKVLETLTYDAPDASSLRSIVMRIKQLNPDSLYIPDAFPLMHGLLSQIRNLGLKELKIFSVYSAQSEDVLKAIGPVGEGLMISYPQIEGEALLYYPGIVSNILGKALLSCPKSDPSCVLAAIKVASTFDTHGVMTGALGLKVVRAGKFEWHQPG